jgi:predicted restriction endonuclease
MKSKKQIREHFRSVVFVRDKHKCVFCDKTASNYKLDAHHITDRSEMPNGGYVLENGISLCSEHHLIAEKFHDTEGKEWEEGFHPDDLYKKINSSKELAIKKSSLL